MLILSAIEHTALVELARLHPHIKRQIAGLQLQDRTNTGEGYFSHFVFDEDAQPMGSNTILSGVSFYAEGPRGIETFSFNLILHAGHIVCLESKCESGLTEKTEISAFAVAKAQVGPPSMSADISSAEEPGVPWTPPQSEIEHKVVLFRFILQMISSFFAVKEQSKQNYLLRVILFGFLSITPATWPLQILYLHITGVCSGALGSGVRCAVGYEQYEAVSVLLELGMVIFLTPIWFFAAVVIVLAAVYYLYRAVVLMVTDIGQS